ncbi:MAG: hypothetical protein ACRD20_02230 [Terriglobales bacterium]
MHPVANAVEISTDEIREAFEKAAVPEFTGQVKVHIRLLPTAAHEVAFTVERSQTRQVDSPGVVRETIMPHVTNDRVNTVRMKLRELKLILYSPVVCVSGNFAQGVLKSFVVQEVQ